MKLEHRIRLRTEYMYGYLVWRAKERERYEKVFPEGEFDVHFMGKIIPKRKVDWKRNRINLYPARKMIDEGDVLVIRREGNSVYIEKRR